LATGLRPDPLGVLKRSPNTLAAMGNLLLRAGEKEGREEEEKGGRGGEGRVASHTILGPGWNL